jgi:hypothetical protein
MPPKTKSTEPSEAEIVFARASVALAKTQRLVASWLPQKSEDELAREKDGNGDEDEDDWEGGGEVGYELYVFSFRDIDVHREVRKTSLT